MNLKLTLTTLAVLLLGGAVAYRLHHSEPHHAAGHRHDHDDHGHDGEEAPSAKGNPPADHASPERQTRVPADIAARAGIATEVAGPASLAETLAVYGAVKLNANKLARAVPRFTGVIQEARKELGEMVQAGDVVATMETNQSLTSLSIKGPISGMIVDRNVSAGETVNEGAALYTIADLTEVWIDLNIPKRDQNRVKVGQSAVIHAEDGGPDATGQIAWLSPLSSPESQTLVARIVLVNTDQRWRPGLYVKAVITLAEHPVAVAVKEEAIHSLSEREVIFTQDGDIYRARPIQAGRRGGGWVEVRHGVNAGEHYVSTNSFLIKADLGKAGAAHEH